jgi:hypothetical protein
MTEENKQKRALLPDKDNYDMEEEAPEVPRSTDEFDSVSMHEAFRMLNILQEKYDNEKTQEEYEQIEEVISLLEEFDMEIEWVTRKYKIIEEEILDVT